MFDPVSCVTGIQTKPHKLNTLRVWAMTAVLPSGDFMGALGLEWSVKIFFRCVFRVFLLTTSIWDLAHNRQTDQEFISSEIFVFLFVSELPFRPLSVWKKFLIGCRRMRSLTWTQPNLNDKWINNKLTDLVAKFDSASDGVSCGEFSDFSLVFLGPIVCSFSRGQLWTDPCLQQRPWHSNGGLICSFSVAHRGGDLPLQV